MEGGGGIGKTRNGGKGGEAQQRLKFRGHDHKTEFLEGERSHLQHHGRRWWVEVGSYMITNAATERTSNFHAWPQNLV